MALIEGLAPLVSMRDMYVLTSHPNQRTLLGYPHAKVSSTSAMSSDGLHPIAAASLKRTLIVG